jgi:glycosyltransferase involved in cell wall biosynthesis
MQRLSASLGVHLEVRVAAPDDELILSLQNAVAFLYAPRLEPLGLGALEANACGTPAIAVAEGGIRETVVDGVNGLLVSTPSEMGAAIDALVANPELRARLSRQCSAWVRDRWTTKRAAEDVEREITSIARRGTPASPMPLDVVAGSSVDAASAALEIAG